MTALMSSMAVMAHGGMPASSAPALRTPHELARLVSAIAAA